jgi:hypothetical protein
MVDILATHRDAILAIAERHGARDVRVFGSFARGEATETSDVDLLVSTTDHTSPWFPAGFKLELEELLARRVDPARLLLVSAGNIGNDELEVSLLAQLAPIEECLMAPGFVELTRDGLVIHEP